MPLLRPRYTARLEIYLVEDTAPEGEIGILYPDVKVVQLRQGAKRRSPFADSAIATTPALLTLPVMQPVVVRIPSVGI